MFYAKIVTAVMPSTATITKFEKTLNKIKMKKIFKYTFQYETYGELIFLASDKKDALHFIKDCNLENIPKEINEEDLHEMDISDNLIFFDNGEWKE